MVDLIPHMLLLSTLLLLLPFFLLIFFLSVSAFLLSCLNLIGERNFGALAVWEDLWAYLTSYSYFLEHHIFFETENTIVQEVVSSFLFSCFKDHLMNHGIFPFSIVITSPSTLRILWLIGLFGLKGKRISRQH